MPSRASRAVAAATASSLLVLLLAPLCGQQAARWRLPDRSAVLFDRQGQLDWRLAAGARTNFGNTRHFVDPVLFAADVAADGRALTLVPWSLQSLGPCLALDLTWGEGDRVERTFPRVEPYGAVTLRGTATVLQDGRQELVLELSRGDIEPADGDPEFLRVESWYLGESLAGRLCVRRQLAAGELPVAAFEWEIEAEATATSGTTRQGVSVHGGERWRRLAVIGPQPGAAGSGHDFAERVQAARAQALLRLRAELSLPDCSGEDQPAGVAGPSLLAARLAALARAGVRGDDDDAQVALAVLQASEFVAPAGIACTLLAVSWLTDDGAGRRTPNGALRKYAQQLARQLLEVRRDVDDQSYWPAALDGSARELRATWLSTQALDEAIALGIRVPAEVFRGVARHLIATARLDQASASGPGSVGWAERDERHAGHCTAAATAGALVALAVCARRLPRSDRLQREIAATRTRGLGWLQRHWTARWNAAPLVVERQREDEHEFALGVLLDDPALRSFGARDPYFEQAMILLLRQRPDGAQPSTVFGTAASLWCFRDHVQAPRTPR